MAKRKPASRRASSRAARDSPGGPGGMAALRRAQEKLRAMGIKLYKHSPPAKGKAAAPSEEPEAPAKGAQAEKAKPAAPAKRRATASPAGRAPSARSAARRRK